jgi:formylmethanofuran dehydrogenase subunit E
MSTEALAGSKLCRKCKKDITHTTRMKDAEGRYLCRACFNAEEQVKDASAGGVCSGCGESFSHARLTSMAGSNWCDGCLKTKFSVKKSFLGKVWSQITGG